MPKPVKKKTQKDENQLAHALVQRLSAPPEPVDFATQYKAHMAKLGQRGGQVSGARRMQNLSPEQRREIASKAARAKWAKRRKAAK